MINTDMGWFEIIYIPTFILDEVMRVNYEYIDESSSMVIQIVNNTWLIRYPCPFKVMFGNGYGFKLYFAPLLNYFGIKPVVTTILKTTS